MNTVDRDGPADGDFARYVEQLTRNAGRTPGRVEPATGWSARATVPTAASGNDEPGSQRREALARQAAESLRKVAARVPGKAVDAGALAATARSLGLRASRWLTVGGVALIVLAILDLFPALSPLPGFALLMLSLFLRRLSTR